MRQHCVANPNLTQAPMTSVECEIDAYTLNTTKKKKKGKEKRGINNKNWASWRSPGMQVNHLTEAGSIINILAENK